MVKITFYGGVGEIGGNKILVEDSGSKVFLDFGLSFAERRKFYSEPWLSPMDERGLLEFGILPDLKGVYRFDTLEAEVDAVLLSHSHADHSMHISFLNRNIPVYCGETSATLLQVFSETRPKDFERDISGLVFKTFRTGGRIHAGSLEIEPIHVDHSVPGSYGFIIHTSQGALVYTGDFRLHGVKPRLTKDLVEKAKEVEPIALMCEGTNIIEANLSSEDEVLQKAKKVVAQTPNLVLAGFAESDIDRLRTFYEVAESTGRVLAISLRQAYLLSVLMKDKGLKIPDVKRDSGIIVFQKRKKRYYDWEEEVLGFENVKDASEVREMQNRVILFSSFSDLKELVDIKPKPGSAYIYSSSEPFNEEQQIEYQRFINWLDHFGLPMYHIHSSGHIFPNDLRWLIGEMKPERLIPIHTEHPEMYAKWSSDAIQKVVIPQRNASVQLER